MKEKKLARQCGVFLVFRGAKKRRRQDNEVHGWDKICRSGAQMLPIKLRQH
jgi:hypothetical protein